MCQLSNFDIHNGDVANEVMQCVQLVLSRSCYMSNQVKLKALTHWSIGWCGRNKINYLGVHKERGGQGARLIKRVQYWCYCCNTHIAPFC